MGRATPRTDSRVNDPVQVQFVLKSIALVTTAVELVADVTPSSTSSLEIRNISRTGALAAVTIIAPLTARKRASAFRSTPIPTDEMKSTFARSSSILERPERIASSSAAATIGDHEASNRPFITMSAASAVRLESIFISHSQSTR